MIPRKLIPIFLFLLTGVFAISLQAQQRKILFILADGIPADVIERVETPHLDAIIAEGGYTQAIMGGEKGGYSETPTVSAVGYNSLLTGTWVNKHNVWGNEIEAPNYHYWTIFRFFKERYPSKTTAIFSSWQDNRTKLIGANLPETNHFSFDFYFDGLELDTLNFPQDEYEEYIYHIDELVADEAASIVKRAAPDLSWVYLWYPDAVGHRYGDGEEMDEAVRMADRQIGRIWEAIQYRKEHQQEEWLLIITTDHGRTEEDGKGHGGQSERERLIWIATNSKDTNPYFVDAMPTMVDILPSIARFMEIPVSKNRAMELDGVSFLGELSASDLKVERRRASQPRSNLASTVAEPSGDDEELFLTWKAWAGEGMARIWIATTNEFKNGGLDHYLLMDEVEIAQEQAVIFLQELPSDFYKIVLETPCGYLNYWIVQE